MCNCNKRRAAGGAAGGGGAPRGCVGPGCVRAVPPQVALAPRSLPPVVVVPVPPIRAGPRGGPVVTPVHVPVPRPIGKMPTEEELPTVDTEIWGPPMWRFLHIASQGSVAAQTRKGAWDELLAAMTTGLPCPDCREHYGTWYATYPLGHVFPGTVMPTKLYSMTKGWLLALHNAVNVRRGVAEWTDAQVAACEAYQGGRVAAREALTAAAAAGVAPWVIAAGEVVIARAMV